MINHEQHRQRLKYAPVSGGKIAYVDQGEGEVILLVHGIPTSSWLYRHMIPLLCGKGYRVIAPDLLGLGASDKPNGYDIYSEENQGKRLLELMHQVQINEWTHVCHDGGGLWTWEMLKQNSVGVKRLVILNTIIYEAGFAPPMRFEAGWIAKIYTSLYKNSLTAGLMINATLKNGLSKKNKLSKADKKGYLIPMKEGGNRVLYYFFTQTCNALPEDYDDLLRSLNIPASVIWGALDPMLKWAPQAEAVQKDLGIKEGNISILEDSSHFIQEEEPERITELLDTFIQKN